MLQHVISQQGTNDRSSRFTALTSFGKFQSTLLEQDSLKHNGVDLYVLSKCSISGSKFDSCFKKTSQCKA